ncbi:alpha-N-acetylglucosaminidase [Persicobacter diffluens]|uniref:Alpha-N-acetylglucosaminidase n=1 Tax=Persicobacter diffluens TaxID=981 RepID=A0AAN4W2A9_9BACT|nr:alpha-N-acetylglucosaminidase [Persicobacter diffluens]
MKRNHIFLLFAFICTLFMNACTSNHKTNQLSEMEKFAHRVMGKQADQLILKVVPDDLSEGEYFLIKSSTDHKVIIEANSKSALSYGLGQYLRKYCHVELSRPHNNIQLPEELPLPEQEFKKKCNLKYRHYLNYCTFNYSMAFWGWEEWQKELDLMALQGINMAYTLTGVEKVWQEVLLKNGYSQKEILDFIPGPSYQAWWLMGNLEGFGGQVSQAWIDKRAELQQKIVGRMHQLGITPVFHGFYGMVPRTLSKKFPEANIIVGGNWCGFYRPDFLDPNDPLFTKMAEEYYESMSNLYGELELVGGDPFHEGGNTKGIDIETAGKAIQTAMKNASPEAIWVIQGWMDNPKEAMLTQLDKEHTLILDLFSDNIPSWKYREAFGGFNFIWNAIGNFGNREDLYGRLPVIASAPIQAQQSKVGQYMQGIGTVPEGHIPNQVVTSMIYDVAWEQSPLKVDQWLKFYTKARYGTENESVNQAWKLLYESVYSCPVAPKGEWGRDESQPIICATPSFEIKSSAPWGNVKPYYDEKKLAQACELLFTASNQIPTNEAFGYDLTVVLRDVLSNKALALYREIQQAYQQKNKALFRTKSDAFLELMDDVDRLVGTQQAFILGQWIEDARKLGSTVEEKDLFEFNARALVSYWGNESDRNNVLKDYAYKQWSGLITDYYKKRWLIFFEHTLANFDKKNIEPLDFVDFSEQWAKKKAHFPAKAQGNSIEVAKALIQKYKIGQPL